MPLIHITRHAQVLPAAAVTLSDGIQLHHGDPALTPLGTHQASLLGERLAHDGFHGEIWASPYRRTVATATAVASACGTRVRLEPLLQEIMREPDGFTGQRGDELAADAAQIDATLPWPWWPTRAETPAECTARACRLIPRLQASSCDVMLIGHGATVNALTRALLRLGGQAGADGWLDCFNAQLTTFAFARGDGAWSLVRLADTGHLPEALVTANELRPADLLRLRQASPAITRR